MEACLAAVWTDLVQMAGLQVVGQSDQDHAGEHEQGAQEVDHTARNNSNVLGANIDLLVTKWNIGKTHTIVLEVCIFKIMLTSNFYRCNLVVMLALYCFLEVQ